jgi:hypothetical protein
MSITPEKKQSVMACLDDDYDDDDDDDDDVGYVFYYVPLRNLQFV